MKRPTVAILVERLETRRCCSADGLPVSASLRWSFDATNSSTEIQATKETHEASEALEMVADQMVAEETATEETVAVETAADETVADEAAADSFATKDMVEVPPTSFDEILLEAAEVNCPGIEDETVEDGDECTDSGCIGQDCLSISQPPIRDKFLDGKPNEDSTFASSSSQQSIVNLAVPAISTNHAAPSDLRPQLQPIEQLSLGRLDISLPAPAQTVQLRNAEMSSPITFNPTSNLGHTAEKAVQALRTSASNCVQSLREDWEAIHTAILKANDTNVAVKRLERFSVRPALAPVARVMLEEIDIVLKSTPTSPASDFQSETEKGKVRVGELRKIELENPSPKRLKVTPGDEVGALPTEPDKPTSKRNHLILGALITAWLPFRNQSWSLGKLLQLGSRKHKNRNVKLNS